MSVTGVFIAYNAIKYIAIKNRIHINYQLNQDF